MANGITHDGANGAISENKNKIVYYYAVGAFTLLLAVKLLSSKFFREAIDFSITYLPFILLLGVVISNVRKYQKHPERGEEIRKNALHKALYLLLITLAFYILYSPGAFLPVGEAIAKTSMLSSLENYFLVLSYIAVIIIALAPIAFFIRLYQKSNGYYKGSMADTGRHLLYSVFFVFVFMFISSVLTYPSAYAPLTSSLSNGIYSVFMRSDNATDVEAQGKIAAIKSALGKTYNNLTSEFSDTNTKLTATISETKATLDTAIARTNESLQNSLSEDIEARLDLTGGTLAGDLTVEDDLVVEGQTTMSDIVPTADDTYDLGSVTKGWDNVYVHALHGSSIITVGDGATSHSLTATDDFLISGDLEVNGTTYFDGAVNLAGVVTFSGTIDAGTKVVANAGDPVNAQDLVTKAYYEANTPTGVFSRVGTVLSPTTSGDSLDMGSGAIGGGAITGTSLTDGTATLTSGALSGVTTLGMGGALSGVTTGAITTLNSTTVNATTLDLGTNTLTDGNLTGDWAGLTNLTVDNVNINGSTINNTSGDLTITAAGGDIDFNNENLATTGTLSAGATTVTTLNTGQGANELYAMNQNVQTTDAVTFASGTIASIIGGTGTTSDLILKTTSGVAASGADMLFQTGNNGGTEAMKIDYNGIVYINSLQSGAQTFENDAGIVQWVDLPVVSATASTVESYSAMLDGSAVLTVYGTSNGSGGMTTDSQSIGIMTTAPAATLHVVNNEGAGATNQGLLLHLDNTAFAGISSTASNNGGGLVITADATAASTFDFMSFISSAGDTDDAEFRVRGDGELYADGAAYNSGADYAEFFYTKNTDLQAGEAVCVDILNKKAVKRCDRANDLNLIGIISTNPAFVGNNIPGAEANLGDIDKNYKLVGLIGQVPAKVSDENGKIQTGDSLTSASKAGYVMKANAGDSTVGVALESFDGKDGVITVLISRKNKSLTVEQVEEETTKRIAEMKIEDEVNAMVATAKEQLQTEADLKFTDYDSQIAELNNLADSLQAQIDELKITTATEANLAQIDLNKNNIDLINSVLGITAEGDSIILKIAAEKIIVAESETGKLTIATADEATDSIGSGIIEVGATGATIETEAVSENSKVFVTPKDITDKTLSVTDINDGNFKVEVSDPAITEVEGSLEFDWWVVRVK